MIFFALSLEVFLDHLPLEGLPRLKSHRVVHQVATDRTQQVLGHAQILDRGSRLLLTQLHDPLQRLQVQLFILSEHLAELGRSFLFVVQVVDDGLIVPHLGLEYLAELDFARR